jgi:hypothetical protein
MSDVSAGQCLYLLKLQQECPRFWTDLNCFWRLGDYSSIQNVWAKAYDAREPWILAAVAETLELWTTEPAGAAARLEPSTTWFATPDFPFSPTIAERPRPTESVVEFADRVRKDFDASLEAWCTRRVDQMGRFADSRQIRSCEWLVRHRAGETYEALGLEYGTGEDPGQFVRRSALRFAEAIGLNSTNRFNSVLGNSTKNVA